MDKPLACATLSQSADGSTGLDIVCGDAVQLNDPEP
jgi:hypothetical protein